MVSSVGLQSSMPFTGTFGIGNGWRWCGLLARWRLFSLELDLTIMQVGVQPLGDL